MWFARKSSILSRIQKTRKGKDRDYVQMVHAGGVRNTADIYDGAFSQRAGIHHRKEEAIPGGDVHAGGSVLPDDFGGAFSAGRRIPAPYN